MALDEALLEAMPRLGKTVLRFTAGRNPPRRSAIFRNLPRSSARRCCVRSSAGRPAAASCRTTRTGLTASRFRRASEWHSLRAEESYRRVHEWIQAAFARLNIRNRTRAVLQKIPARPVLCGPRKVRPALAREKIAGAAQRRTRAGLLIQGSVQPPPLGLVKIDWQKVMCDAAHFDFGVQWAEFEPDTLLRERAETLARDKYSVAAYNQKR